MCHLSMKVSDTFDQNPPCTFDKIRGTHSDEKRSHGLNLRAEVKGIAKIRIAESLKHNFVHNLCASFYNILNLRHGHRHPTPYTLLHDAKSLKHNIIHNLCICVSDKHIYQISSFYNVAKLRYGPLKPYYIKMYTTSHEIT